jgi:hypothetical protein
MNYAKIMTFVQFKCYNKKMSSPISIKQPRRNTISTTDVFGSSHENAATSVPIKINLNSGRRARVNTESSDAYFSSILATPSLSKISRFQGYSMMEQGKDQFLDLYKSSKSSGFSVSSSQLNTKKEAYSKRDKLKGSQPGMSKEKATTPRTRSSSISMQRNAVGTYAAIPPSSSITHQPARDPVPGVIHPSIIKVGLLISRNILSGSNGRCMAMLEAFKDVITYSPCIPFHKAYFS